MVNHLEAEPRGPESKRAVREIWALGDYHRVATSTVWELGPVLVEACGISSGMRVLDVGAGTGNVAIRAAKKGATVVASDLTPEHFDAGRRAADAEGVELEWVEADAEALPFEEEEFDVVTSSLGAMFAPDHQRVANELLRVCRSGGTIGMINFTPEGNGGSFFRALAPFMPPPPPGASSPLSWGSEEHVRDLFGDRIDSLAMTRREYVESASSAEAYCALFRESFGPIVAIHQSAGADQRATVDRALRDFAARASLPSADGSVRIPFEYLLFVARKR
jgi:ubiquinone/menaquinone biosynthesis C-methylase UbiE